MESPTQEAKTDSGCNDTEQANNLSAKHRVARLPSRMWTHRKNSGLEGGKASARRKLGDITEQRVLKTGIRMIRDHFVPQASDKVFEFPTRPNGTSLLLRPAFLLRLLKQEIEMQSAMSSDVATAQSDIKHLSLVQLLELRARTLDFQTESRTHEAHNNFLQIVDNRLFAQIAQRLLSEVEGSAEKLHAPPGEALQRLGFRLALTVGAAVIFKHGIEAVTPKARHEQMPDQLVLSLPSLPEADANGEDPALNAPPPSPASGLPSPSSSTEPLPSQWVLGLDPAEWHGQRAAFFNPWDLSLQVVGESHEAMAAAANGKAVAIVWDRSGGTGKDRSFHWEVASVTGSGEDILSELNRSERGRLRTSSSFSRQGSSPLAEELKAAFLRRSATFDSSKRPSSGLTLDENFASGVEASQGLDTPSTQPSTNPNSPEREE